MATIPIWDRKSCKKKLDEQSSWYGLSIPIEETQICAGYKAGGVDACQVTLVNLTPTLSGSEILIDATLIIQN